MKKAQSKTPIKNIIKSGSRAIKPLDLTKIDEEVP